jgi:hypothetical protein
MSGSEFSFRNLQPSAGQPDPHEDLTIAQTVEAMRKEGDPDRLLSHVSAEALDEFLLKWGAEHPSNYESKTGRDWKSDLFGV